jgi:small subunit ribosomal protein S2
MRQLLEAGVHFGHTTRRWNPKMEPFIYGERNDIHILDLQQTVPLLSRSLEAVRNVVANGGRVLMVGTKRQASEYVAEAAARCGQYYVNHRWLGGMLTNWKTISHSIKRLRQVQEILDEGGAGLTKKETLNLTRERDKLERALGGIKDMGGLPDLIFIIDTNKEHLAINEANKLGIPVAAVLDSNSDPYGITYPIPGNDDALRAISLYCELVGDAVLDGIQAEMSQTGEDPGAAEDAGEKIPEEAELAEAATQSAEGAGDGQAAEQGPGAEGQGAEGQAGESAAGDAGSADQSGESAEPKAAESQATSA